MGKYVTKYFGELIIDENGTNADFDLTYKSNEINIYFSDLNLYKDKIRICIDMLDKYLEIDKIAKESIIEHFPEKKGLINYYFKCHFEMLDEDELEEIFGTKSFKKLDINKAVSNLYNPNIVFSANNGVINMTFDYVVSEEYSDEILVVIIDEELNIIKYSHES
jgi:hypothetical protein